MFYKQWPFDTRKIKGSSQVDILVEEEIQKGRQVYMDFCQNPKGLESGFDKLSSEAYIYLEKSQALFGAPIERLALMNQKAIELYFNNGIDLWKEPIQVAVCAQHCNGGIEVNANWESNIKGIYAVGEAAGTFGVYRPGGSALNSTQVGSLRAAEHISSKKKKNEEIIPKYEIPNIKYGKSNLDELYVNLQKRMSECAAFNRDIDRLNILLDEICNLHDSFFDTVIISNTTQLPKLFKLHDLTITARAVLSAIIFSAVKYGSHGSALVNGLEFKNNRRRNNAVTVTNGKESYAVPVRPIPKPDLWFESVWNKFNSEHNVVL